MQLNYLESGQGERTVILLHGLFGSASNLNALAKALAEDYRVFRVDLRNHGESFHLDTMSLKDMAGDVLRLLKHLDVSEAAFVGHSLGGKVAMQFAHSWPEYVTHLVVADIAPVAYKPHHNATLAAMCGIDLRALKSRSDADAQLAAAEEELGVRQFLLKNLARNDEGGWRWKLNLAAIDHCYDDLRQAPEGKPYTGPTLFIKGENSAYIQTSHSNAMQQQFPSHRLSVINGTGHWLHAEKPAAFNALVSGFLAGG